MLSLEEVPDNRKNLDNVEELGKLRPNLSQKEQEELGRALLGKMEDLFHKRLSNFVTRSASEIPGQGTISIEIPEIWEFKWFNFKCSISWCEHHYDHYWKDEYIYKNICECREIEELIRAIRQYKKEAWFYVDEDDSDIFKTLEAKSLANIMLELRSGFLKIERLWVKDKDGKVCALNVNFNWFAGPFEDIIGKAYFLVHVNDVNPFDVNPFEDIIKAYSLAHVNDVNDKDKTE